MTLESIPAHLRREIDQFLGWMVNMANRQEDTVPPSIRLPLRRDASIGRLRKIDPECERPDGTFCFPSEVAVAGLIDQIKLPFEKIWEFNRRSADTAYRLPMPPIIGDFLAGHIDLSGSGLNIRNLRVVTPEILEFDFKAQTNYSLSQTVCLLRYSPKHNRIQASEHIAIRKKYQTADELAKEFEQGLLQSYAMCLASLPPESQQNPDHISAIQQLVASVEAYGRGENIQKIWIQLYNDLQLKKLGIASIKEINRVFTDLSKKKKKDRPIESVEDLQTYYHVLYSSLSFFGIHFEAIKAIISNYSHRYFHVTSELKQTYPAVVRLLNTLKPLSEVPAIQSALLPLIFENISPEFLPIESDDRLLALAFPPANFATHWVKYIYIVDSEHCVKVSPEMLTGKNKGKRISHSQLSNWGPVKAAGEVYFAKQLVNNRIRWVCVEINNGSGHYEPDAEGSLMVAKDAIAEALRSTDILFDPTITSLRNVLLPGVPAHSFLK